MHLSTTEFDLRLRAETPADDDAIRSICEEAFGPGRFARAAERVREMAAHAPAYSFVAESGDALVGSVRLTPVAVGGRPVLMLGPLAVRPAFKGRGAGRGLMALAEDAARKAGEALIFLVGDRAYYMPLGYRPVPPGAIVMPGPVDPARILALPLKDGALDGLAGQVSRRAGV